MHHTIEALKVGSAMAEGMWQFESLDCGSNQGGECTEQDGVDYHHPIYKCSFDHCPRIHQYLGIMKTGLPARKENTAS